MGKNGPNYKKQKTPETAAAKQERLVLGRLASEKQEFDQRNNKKKAALKQAQADKNTQKLRYKQEAHKKSYSKRIVKTKAGTKRQGKLRQLKNERRRRNEL